MSSREAQFEANKYNLDLYCVAPKAEVPVCKIIDYGKFKFEQQKKAKESKKKQHVVEIKEVQLTPQIGEHDLLIKVKNATKFLNDGNKVKVGVRFRGRQMAHIEIGEEIMNKFISYLEEVGTVEKKATMEGRWLNAVIAPKVKKQEEKHMGKMKSKKAFTKRVKATGSGQLKKRSAYRAHLAPHKSTKQKRHLRKDRLMSKSDLRRDKELIQG